MSGYIASLSEQEVWQKFYELSLELKKFLLADDTDMFLEILQQREAFEKSISQRQPEFIKTAAGQELLKQVIILNRYIISNGEGWLNKTRRGWEIGQQYETQGRDIRGFRIDGRG